MVDRETVTVQDDTSNQQDVIVGKEVHSKSVSNQMADNRTNSSTDLTDSMNRFDCKEHFGGHEKNFKNTTDGVSMGTSWKERMFGPLDNGLEQPKANMDDSKNQEQKFRNLSP